MLSYLGDLPANKEVTVNLLRNKVICDPPVCVMDWNPFNLHRGSDDIKVVSGKAKIAGDNDSDLSARPNMRRVETGCSLALMMMMSPSLAFLTL